MGIYPAVESMLAVIWNHMQEEWRASKSTAKKKKKKQNKKRWKSVENAESSAAKPEKGQRWKEKFENKKPQKHNTTHGDLSLGNGGCQL